MNEKPQWRPLRAYMARLRSAGLSATLATSLAREARELHARRYRAGDFELAEAALSVAAADEAAALASAHRNPTP